MVLGAALCKARSWALMILVGPFLLRIFCNSVILLMHECRQREAIFERVVSNSPSEHYFGH